MPQATGPAAGKASRRPRFEIADVFRAAGDAYRRDHPLSGPQLQAMQAIQDCRTARLGGHLERCDQCNFERPAYNSCRNRHCPKCQVVAKVDWLERRRAELLPVPYFHAVFTLPHEINPFALRNQRLVYGLLFRTVSAVLQEFAADPRHGLGGQLGFTAILHTWDQKLGYHMHLHCLIPAGVLAFDQTHWVPARNSFLFPVRALSRLFRGKFIHALRHADPKPASVGDIRQLVASLRKKEWVVFCRPPFDGPERTLDYLGRYTHRIAISNHRLLGMSRQGVAFRYRDRRDGDRRKAMTLPAQEFIQRFLMHVLPSGFMRIRHFGFLANRCKKAKLTRCRSLLNAPTEPPSVADAPTVVLQRITGVDPLACPACKQGTLTVIARLEPHRARRSQRPRPPPCTAAWVS